MRLPTKQSRTHTHTYIVVLWSENCLKYLNISRIKGSGTCHLNAFVSATLTLFALLFTKTRYFDETWQFEIVLHNNATQDFCIQNLFENLILTARAGILFPYVYIQMYSIMSPKLEAAYIVLLNSPVIYSHFSV